MERENKKKEKKRERERVCEGVKQKLDIVNISIETF